MGIRLSKAQLARHEACICPGNIRREGNLPFIRWSPLVTIILVGVVVALWNVEVGLGVVALVALLAAYVCAFIFRLIRGHSLRCCLFWGYIGSTWLTLGILSNL